MESSHKRKSRSSFSVRIITAVVSAFLLFGILAGAIGYCVYRFSFITEYDASARRMALGAAAMIEGDRISDCLSGREDGADLPRQMEDYCRRTDQIRIDVLTSDGRAIFSAVNPAFISGNAAPCPETDSAYQQACREVYESATAYKIIRRADILRGRFDTMAFVPVRDADGQVAAVMSLQRSNKPLADALLYYIVTMLAVTAVFAAVVSLISSLYLKKEFIRPIEAISAEAERFVDENTIRQPLGSLSRIDELSGLAGSIDQLEARITDYINDLTAAAAEKERLRTEISLAGKIQSGQLPDAFPAFPDRHDFDIAGSVTPALMVGGDFFNYLLLDDDHLAMWVGDVSGKGIPAALFMMSANLLLSSRVRFRGSPAEILADVNNRLCENNKAGMFVTVWLAILEISTGRLTAANGGHECPAVCRDSCFDLFKDRHGLVLGGMKGSQYRDYTLSLSPGDKVFMYSDGVTEARNSSGEMFLSSRMIESLNRHGGSPMETIRALKTNIDAFAGNAPPFDDITMLLLEYKGKQAE